MEQNTRYNTKQWNINSIKLIKSDLSRLHRDMMIKRSKFNKLLKDKNKKILDIGCGSGAFLKYFHRRGYRNLYGVEPDKELAKEIPKDVAKVKVAFAEKLPFKKKMFDAVFVYGVLHHLKGAQNYIKSLKEIDRVLKRRGVIFIMEPGRWRVFRLMEISVKALSPFLKTFKTFSRVLDEERKEQHFFIKNHSIIRDFLIRKKYMVLVDRYFIYSWIFTAQKSQ